MSDFKEWSRIPQFNEIREEYPTIKKALFDMDGTLLDSEVIHMKALQVLINEDLQTSLEFHEVYSEFIGISDQDSYELICSRYGQLSESLTTFLCKKQDLCHEAVNNLIEKDELFDPKIMKLIKDMKNNDWELAIVTASERSFLDLVLKNINENYFKINLSANDTTRTKPYPDPYLKAMDLMGDTEPKNYVIFEDSITGLMAAQRSGAIVNKVTWFNNV